MALSITRVSSYVIGDHREVIADVTFDASYTTGGLALTAAQLGMGTSLRAVIPTPSTDGHTFAYDYANSKLKAFSGASEVANATDLHTLTTRIVVHGKGAGNI